MPIHRRADQASVRQPKHVLIVSSHFPPERAAAVHRILRTMKQLCASNWPVSVLTVDPQYYKSGTPVDPSLVGRLPDDVKVYRAKVLRGLTVAARWRRQLQHAVNSRMRRLFGSADRASGSSDRSLAAPKPQR